MMRRRLAGPGSRGMSTWAPTEVCVVRLRSRSAGAGAQGAADGRLERDQRLMEIVLGVQGVALRDAHRGLGVEQLDHARCPQSVALACEREPLLRHAFVVGLES